MPHDIDRISDIYLREALNLIENEFPHITLLIGEYKSVDSNYVLKALFGDDGQFRLIYQSGQIKDLHYKINTFVENVKIQFGNNGREEIVDRVYLLKFGEFLSLDGITTTN